MDITQSSWNLTMLAVHVGIVFALFSLWKSCPDWVQRFVIFSLTMAYLFFATDSVMHLLAQSPSDVDHDKPLWRLATAFEHVAVILYIARLWLQEHDEPCKNSLEHYRNSDPSSKNSV